MARVKLFVKHSVNSNIEFSFERDFLFGDAIRKNILHDFG